MLQPHHGQMKEKLGSAPTHLLYPYLLIPCYKNYVWGGERIPRLFNRTLPPGRYAESWEVADRPEGSSTVANGPLSGKTLTDVVRDLGPLLLGSRRDGRFPLLIKLIDAATRLSLQVHPSEETAALVHGEPKTEAWYVLDAPPGAAVLAGLRAGATPALFSEPFGITEVEQAVDELPVAPGDLVFLPGGCVHALTAGCLVLEIQQSSDTTFRLFDWGRVDDQGRPRPLHVKEAVQVMRAEAQPVRIPRPIPSSAPEPHGILTLWHSRHFRIESILLRQSLSATLEEDTFHALFVEEGTVDIQPPRGPALTAQRGCSCLLPAGLGGYDLTPGTPAARLLRTSMPQPC